MAKSTLRGKTYAQRKAEADARATKLVTALRASGKKVTGTTSKTVAKQQNIKYTPASNVNSIAKQAKISQTIKTSSIPKYVVQAPTSKTQAAQVRQERSEINFNSESRREESRERILQPEKTPLYFDPKESLRMTGSAKKTQKTPLIDRFISSASTKIKRFETGVSNLQIRIETNQKKIPLVGKLFSGSSYGSQLALKTTTALPSGIVGTVGGFSAAAAKIGVLGVATVGGRGKDVVQEIKRAGRKTPKVIQEQFVTIEDGKVSFTPQQVVAIGGVVVGTVVGGALRNSARTGKINTKTVTTTSSKSTVTKTGVIGTEKGTFQNVKGQTFTYETITKMPPRIKGTPTSSGLQTFSQKPGTYTTVVKNSAGKIIKTTTGKIKPQVIETRPGTGFFFEKTKLTTGKLKTTKITETGTRTGLTQTTTGKTTFAQTLIDKQSKLGKIKTSTIGLKSTETIGKTTSVTTFPKSVVKAPSGLQKLGGTIKTAIKQSFPKRLLTSKKGSLSTTYTGFGSDIGTVKGFGSDFGSFKPTTQQSFTSQISKPVKPAIVSTPSQIPVSQAVLMSQTITPTIVPVFKFQSPTKSNIITKGTSSYKPVDTSKGFFDVRYTPQSIFKPKALSDPIGETIPQPIIEPLISTIPEPVVDPGSKPSTRTYTEYITEPTPVTPTPITAPSIGGGFPSIPIIPFIPYKRSPGSLGSSFFGFGSLRKSRIKSFKPTIRGSAFGIKGKTRKGAVFTGLGDRFSKR